jgi:hypothetical protein
MISDISDDIGYFLKIPLPRLATKWHQYFMHVMDVHTHCKSGPHKNGIRKSSRKTYDHIMGIYIKGLKQI